MIIDGGYSKSQHFQQLWNGIENHQKITLNEHFWSHFGDTFGDFETLWSSLDRFLSIQNVIEFRIDFGASPSVKGDRGRSGTSGQGGKVGHRYEANYESDLIRIRIQIELS